MKSFKTIFVLLAAVALIALPAKAQFFGGAYGSVTVSGYPSTVAASTATNFISNGTNAGLVSAIYVPNGNTIHFQAQIQGNGAGTANDIIWFSTSPDGITWDTSATSLLALILPANGTTASLGSTNFTLGAAGWIIPYYTTNAAASVNYTNCFLKYSLKPGY